MTQTVHQCLLGFLCHSSVFLPIIYSSTQLILATTPCSPNSAATSSPLTSPSSWTINIFKSPRSTTSLVPSYSLPHLTRLHTSLLAHSPPHSLLQCSPARSLSSDATSLLPRLATMAHLLTRLCATSHSLHSQAQARTTRLTHPSLHPLCAHSL